MIGNFYLEADHQLMSYLHYLCLFANSDVQHILCCACVLFFVFVCTLCCQFLCIVHFWLPFRYSLTFNWLSFVDYVSNAT
jgi:hypothetical protein